MKAFQQVSAVELEPTLIYIMSPSYSGSTLLTAKMAERGALSTIGELKLSSLGDIDVYRCGCGELIRACQFWRELTDRLVMQGYDFDLSQPGTHFGRRQSSLGRVVSANVRPGPIEMFRDLAIGLLPSLKRSVARLVWNNATFMNTVCSMQGTRFFLDGSKDPLRLKYFIKESWNIKVIYLTRDGRGTSNSIRKYEKKTVAAAARDWRLKVQEMMRVKACLDHRQVYDLKYEDFCLNPEHVMNQLFEFIGLEKRDGLGPELPELHILGNDNMRKNRDRPIRLDEKWKADLTESDLNAFYKEAGAVNKGLGYL